MLANLLDDVLSSLDDTIIHQWAYANGEKTVRFSTEYYERVLELETSKIPSKSELVSLLQTAEKIYFLCNNLGLSFIPRITYTVFLELGDEEIVIGIYNLETLTPRQIAVDYGVILSTYADEIAKKWC